MHELSPGPVYGLPNLTGQHEHDPSSRFPKGPAYSLSPRREVQGQDAGPGPTLYPGDKIYRTGKDGGREVVIRGRDDGMKLNPNPGPGQYDPQRAESKVKPCKPAFSFGKKGFEPKIDDLPGPGNYEVSTGGHVKTFTLGARPRSQGKSTNPGPADYNLPYKIYRQGPDGNRGFTMQKRNESSQSDNNPGPGSYDYENALTKTRKRVPAPDFGGKAKHYPMDNNPGPGTYNPSWGNGNKGFTMGGRESNPKFTDSPGPGEYSVNDRIYNNGKETGRTIRITGRPNDHYGGNTPGPGWYSPEGGYDKGKAKIPAFSMGEKRDIHYGDANPGPGYYNPNDRKTGPGIQIKGRPKDAKGNDLPGPGQYNIDDKLTNRGKNGGKGFAFRGREKSWGHDDNPGPGSYAPEASPRDKTKGPQWSFGDKPNVANTNYNPGPGSYDPNDGYNVKGPKIRDGHNSRGNYENSNTPGPNYYNIDPNISKKTGKGQPAFSLGGRDNQPWSKNDTPGPGSYTPDLNKESHHGPGYTFGEKHKGTIDPNPGPGYYDPDPMLGKTVRSTKPSLPQFSLGLKNRDGDVNTRSQKQNVKLPPIENKN